MTRNDEMNGGFYDRLSDLYDVMIDWESRLRTEGPLLVKWLQENQARRVLDVACGTGGHVHYLAEQGFEVIGADINATMLEKARLRANPGGKPFPKFVHWAMNDAPPSDITSVDALLCLGNSFPHLLEPASADAAFHNFHQLLNPRGRCLIQLKNLLRRLKQKDMFLPLARRIWERKRLRFVRFYDPSPDRENCVEFHWIAFGDDPDGLLKHAVTTLRAWTVDELNTMAHDAGFTDIRYSGDLKGAPFDPDRSEDIVMVALK